MLLAQRASSSVFGNFVPSFFCCSFVRGSWRGLGGPGQHIWDLRGAPFWLQIGLGSWVLEGPRGAKLALCTFVIIIFGVAILKEFGIRNEEVTATNSVASSV